MNFHKDTRTNHTLTYATGSTLLNTRNYHRRTHRRTILLLLLLLLVSKLRKEHKSFWRTYVSSEWNLLIKYDSRVVCDARKSFRDGIHGCLASFEQRDYRIHKHMTEDTNTCERFPLALGNLWEMGLITVDTTFLKKRKKIWTGF